MKTKDTTINVEQWGRRTSSYSGYGLRQKRTFPNLEEARKFVRKQPLESKGIFPEIYTYSIFDEKLKNYDVLSSEEKRELNKEPVRRGL